MEMLNRAIGDADMFRKMIGDIEKQTTVAQSLQTGENREMRRRRMQEEKRAAKKAKHTSPA